MISVLFENEDLVALDKPEGLSAIPERDRTADSLLEILSIQRREKLYVVHRIDKETSGLIVFAKNAEAHRWLNGQFEARAVEKTYLALVHGVVGEDEGLIDKPLRQFGSGRVGVDPGRGKVSLTKFRVVQRFDSFTLVEAHPKTGRRHQIRVHLFSVGHPITGDPLYGDKTIQRNIPRLMLHARRIALSTPWGEPLTIEAPASDSFKAVLDTIS